MACAIYIPGAASASNSTTVSALFSDFIKESQPTEGFLMWSMVVVLLTTRTMLVAQGWDYLPLWNKNGNHNFNGGGLLWLFLGWTLAPSIACLCAWFLFAVLKSYILRCENAERRILVFLPIDHGASAGLLCFIITSQVIGNYVDVNRLTVIIAVAGSTLIGTVLSLVVVVPLAMKKLATIKNYRNSMENTSMKQESVESRENRGLAAGAKVDEDDIDEMLKDFMQMRVLDTVHEEEERSWGSPDAIQESEQVQVQPISQCGANTSTDRPTPFKQLLTSTPNRLVQTKIFQRIEKSTPMENVIKFIRDMVKSTFFPVSYGPISTLSAKLYLFFFF
ncbi:hypothetical protein V6N11_032546 [Hibiscus sabdariffa]|uniref:Uncharacterized protein n=1 Tax=Hibiscus sabdariffa TaxID=183260 RepID=A0ABR2T1N9_9ROSI